MSVESRGPKRRYFSAVKVSTSDSSKGTVFGAGHGVGEEEPTGSSSTSRSHGAHRGAASRALLAALLVVVPAAVAPLAASADARTDYLVRALRSSSMFRVRAQAAISLGAVQAEPQVIEALTQALSDDHPAVRAASAAALERLGDPSALPALRRASGDREAAVRNAAERAVRNLERMARSRPRSRTIPGRGSAPSRGGGPGRFYVAVGRPGSNVRGVSRDVLESAQAFVERTARGVSGVEIAPSNERPAAANRVLRDRDLVGYYLDVSIVSLEERPGGGLRASVQVVVQSYPDRNIRSMLNGAATVMGARGSQAQQQAIEGALRGALRNLPQAMEAGAASAQASPRRRRRR